MLDLTTASESPMTAKTDPPVQLTLPNGLRVALLHDPALVQAAAVVRVAAGGHDAPVEYPGLAHFLEHLLFLDSEAFPADQGLMAYVQRCAGQVNASTRERDSYYFFEVPVSDLDGGLARLCDMLAHPRLALEAQLREREVLEAEFQARSRDTDTLCDAALARVMQPSDHPFLGFHAGHRGTLPVEQAAFQNALAGFHQRFYQAGQMLLVLAGPQPLERLRELAELYGGRLPAGTYVPQSVPPVLRLPASTGLRVEAQPGRLSLYGLLDDLPDTAGEALDFLGECLAREESGGLPEWLSTRAGCDSLRLRVSYRYAGQAVVAVEFGLGEAGEANAGTCVSAFFDWLDFFAAADWGDLRCEHARSVEMRERVSPPLARARAWAERLRPHEGATAGEGLSESGLLALRAILTQLRRQQRVELLTVAAVSSAPADRGFPVKAEQASLLHGVQRQYGPWCLPPANPFLAPPVASSGQQVAVPGAFHWKECNPPFPGQAAVFLRWSFPEQPARDELRHTLAAALQPVVQAARQAAVDVRVDGQGGDWVLSLCGLALSQPAILGAALKCLSVPSADAREWGIQRRDAERRRVAGELLIRRLLNELADAFDAPTEADAIDAGAWQDALARCWRMACWDGLALGYAGADRQRLEQVLSQVPGEPSRAAAQASIPEARYRWRDAAIPAGECGLLLFCPLPDAGAETEAAWRLLGRCLEPAFYRRLRSELQLGYAIFSGFRSVGRSRGLLFAVQSPSATAAQILSHIEAFLDDQAAVLSTLEETALREMGADLAGRLSRFPSLRAAAEWHWQAHLEQVSIDHLERLCGALRMLDRSTLLAHHQALREAQGGWRVLANAAPVDSRWQ